jgi:2-keto-3-deoxy-L-rhamnonate aldolase RhmA
VERGLVVRVLAWPQVTRRFEDDEDDYDYEDCMRTNRMKAKLQAGEPVLGSTLSLAEPFVAEIMGAAGFDFLLIDTEHVPLSIHQLQNLLIGAHPTESTIIVRAQWNDPVVVKQILDVGAEGIIFPWINSRAECEAAVAATKYPPRGIRGFGPRRAHRLAGGMKEYARAADDQILVLAQIERIEAVERLDEILTTPGLDGVMVGPADLAISMGYLNDLENPAVEPVIRQILEGCRAHGVPFGMFTGTAEKARRWIHAGGQIATVGGDVTFIDQGIARTKQEIAEILTARP